MAVSAETLKTAIRAKGSLAAGDFELAEEKLSEVVDDLVCGLAKGVLNDPCFIGLTGLVSGDRFYVAISAIESVYSEDGETQVDTVAGSGFVAKESVEQVMELIGGANG